ncbi:TIGR04141 family sporadically distributed protein [Neisseria weaveri]|uniref:TIGR04141 family sporadically distributed protein n=1 Tax=Neisseria weaveri TaxID=28091 RepID=UPI000D2F8FAE|nr:TIGR04141 family sporadically distributed protein [Neisseria weaveri]
MEKKKKTYPLSIFLLKESIKQEDQVIQGIGNLKKIILKMDGGQELVLYSKQNPPRPPSWVNLFKPHIDDDLSHLFSSGCAAVLLMKHNDRYFALTFGYGRHLLNPDCFEENFGLRVVVNAVDPGKLRSVDVHTLESIPVHKKNQASVSTSFADFGLDVEQDLMYAATGSPKDKEFCKTLSGKDALKISLPFELQDLPLLLDRTITLFDSESYKQSFPWIDRLSEVRNVSIKNELDAKLIEKIAQNDFSKTWLSIPEVINWENISGFRYQKAKRGELHDDISWEGYLAYTKNDSEELSIKKMREQYIHCINVANEQPAYTWKVYQCIYCELELNGEVYSLTNGKWYKIDGDFLENLDKNIQDIPLSKISLPEYSEKSEDKYNEKVVNSDGSRFVLMDKRNISYGGGSSRIELCDIYTNDKKLIHVKRYGGSSVLSHLFSQGLVSTQLILSDGNFRALVNKKLPKTHKLPAKNEKPKASEFEVVYVIASNDKKTTALDLPLFSKINLRSCYNRLQLMGVSVSICIVPVVINDLKADVS